MPVFQTHIRSFSCRGGGSLSGISSGPQAGVSARTVTDVSVLEFQSECSRQGGRVLPSQEWGSHLHRPRSNPSAWELEASVEKINAGKLGLFINVRSAQRSCPGGWE